MYFPMVLSRNVSRLSAYEFDSSDFSSSLSDPVASVRRKEMEFQLNEAKS